MDLISSLQLRKYEEILQEINSEFEKSERLKQEIQRTEDTVTALRLSLATSKHKISHVNVKIFNSVAELANLFDCDVNACCDVEALSKARNCYYFLIEVILTKSLLSKLIDSKWKLKISIQSGGTTSCKVVSLINSTSILEVIPFDSNVYECTVDTSLFYYLEEEWILIDLHSIVVDISYHFESYKEKSSSHLESLLNLTKLYNKINLSCVQPSLQIQLKCGFDKNNIVASFVRNSYHRMNLESFSEFVNDSRRVVDVQFTLGDKKVIVLYNKDTNILKIKCSAPEMLPLKKFFIQYSACDYKDFRKKLKVLRSLKDTIEEMDLNEILAFYQELRKLWL